MRKFIMLLVVLVIAAQCWAEGYETKTAFVLDAYPDTNKLGRVLGDCIKGTEEEDDTDKIRAMIEASVTLYQATLAYQVAPTDKDKLIKQTEAMLKEMDLSAEAIKENALCRGVRIPLYFQRLADVVSDINSVTKQGWEVKSSRRAWLDIWANNEIDDFEWGTEYVLQKPIPNQK